MSTEYTLRRKNNKAEYYCELGIEDNKRAFFGVGIDANKGILLGSTRLPNEGRLVVIRWNKHNGISSNEIRLIYVVQQLSGLPLFFRYVSGNLNNGSSIEQILNKMEAMKIDAKFSIVEISVYRINQK